MTDDSLLDTIEFSNNSCHAKGGLTNFGFIIYLESVRVSDNNKN